MIWSAAPQPSHLGGTGVILPATNAFRYSSCRLGTAYSSPGTKDWETPEMANPARHQHGCLSISDEEVVAMSKEQGAESSNQPREVRDTTKDVCKKVTLSGLLGAAHALGRYLAERGLDWMGW